MIRKRHGSAALARRARCVLLWADGERRVDIRAKLACNDAFVSRWTKAFESQGLAGLVSLHPGRAPKQPVAKLEARVLNKTLKHKPRDGSTHWSSRKLAAELGDVSFSAVQRIWRKHGIQPHRLERHMVSNDPDFEAKAADVIGLYLNPPAHAAVFCVDEKTAIQALDRKDRMLPLSPGRAESHGFEYKRNGTLSLFAALNTATGEVLGKTAPRHTSEQFVTFLAEVVATQPEQREIHVICDNVSSHKTELVAAFLAEHRACADPLHADLLVLAQPGRELVLPHPARRDQPRHLHLGQGPRQEAHALHPRIQQGPKAAQVEVRRSLSPTPPILLIQWTRRTADPSRTCPPRRVAARRGSGRKLHRPRTRVEIGRPRSSWR